MPQLMAGNAIVPDAVLDRDLETAPVARRQQLRLAVRPAAPDRADGVDHELRRQPEAGRDLRVAGVASAEEAAGGDELGTGGAVDGAVDASAAEERGVGGVDDRVDGELRDVALHDLELRHFARPSFTTMSNSLFVTGWIERREPFFVTTISSRPGVDFSVSERHDVRERLDVADVDHVPDRILGRRFRIVVVVTLLRRELVGIRLAGDLGDAGDAGGIGVRGVEEHAIAFLHLVANEIARLIVANAFPARRPVARQFLDRVRRRLTLHQPVLHAAIVNAWIRSPREEVLSVAMLIRRIVFPTAACLLASAVLADEPECASQLQVRRNVGADAPC